MLAGVNVFLVYLWPSDGLKQIKANGLILFTYVNKVIRFRKKNDDKVCIFFFLKTKQIKIIKWID